MWSMNLSSFRFVSGLRQALFCAATAILSASAASYVLAESTTFAVEVRGSGPAVILIPGLGCAGAVWKTTVDALAADHECHVFTLAGFSGEPPVMGPFLDGREETIKNYIKTRGLEKPVIIGHSLGGLLALRLAAHLQPAPSAVIVVDSLPFFAGVQPGATAETAKQYAEFLQKQMTEQSREAFLASSQQSAAMLVTAEADRARVADWMSKSDQSTVAQAMAELVAYDGRPLLPEITCPVLIVEAGVVPGAVPEEIYQSQYAGLKDVKRIRVADARHFVMLDQPKRFLQEIHAFLQADAR